MLHTLVDIRMNTLMLEKFNVFEAHDVAPIDLQILMILLIIIIMSLITMGFH